MLVIKLSKPFAFTALFIFCSLLTHQVSLNAELKLYNWKTYTSLANVHSISVDSRGKIWAGTSGGVFIYDRETDASGTDKIKEIRNTEGLLSLDVTCVKCNNDEKAVYIGTSDGVLHIATEDFQWDYITDIVNAKYPAPEINDIIFYGDFAFLAGGFGLTKFSLKDRVFIETVVRFSSFTSNIKVNKILIFDGYIWAATNEGIVRTSVDSSIANPQVWEVFSIENGLPEKVVTNLVNFNDTLFAATNNQICKFTDTGFETVQSSSNEITGLIAKNDGLIYSAGENLYDVYNNKIEFDKQGKINSIFHYQYNTSDELIVLFEANGFSRIGNGIDKNVLPNTPGSNNFMNLDVDNKSRLWVATKSKSSMDGQGFMMLDKDGRWLNFNTINYSNFDDQCIKINAVSNNRVFISTWGGGLIKLTESDGSFDIEKFDNTNSPFTGATLSNQNYVITGEAVEDNNGKVWVINYGEGNPGPVLASMDWSGNILTFNNNESLTDRQFLELAIDNWGTKWLGSNNFAKGMYYFNDNRTPEDKSDDIYGKLTKSNSTILDNEQTAIAVDKTGFIWIGSGYGLNFIYDSYPAAIGEKIVVREEKSYTSGHYVHDIYVDALNNKWVATNKGIWILNEDGSEVLNKNGEILNSINSPLIDDEVFSITSDPTTGIMYFGTKKGLSAARSLSVQPIEEYKIKCYPQPFNPLTDSELLIDGLKENSDVRILTVDGSLVRALSAKGRVASWDGKDESGAVVSSGVYLVVGASETSEGGGVGKFTVIKK
ncbi:hypothetical protein ACFLSQ_02565 [Bacteroidota bacterium]